MHCSADLSNILPCDERTVYAGTVEGGGVKGC